MIGGSRNPVVASVARKAAVCGLLCVALTTGVASQTPAAKRVLLIQQTRFGDTGNARFDAAFLETLRNAVSVPIEVNNETIETLRVPNTRRVFTDYLRNKYAQRRIDVLVAIGAPALTFARQNREMFGSPPIVAAVSQANQFDMSDNITGLQTGPAIWMDGMMELVRAVRPDTCCLYVVDGVRGNTGELAAEVQRQWQEHHSHIRLIYLRDLPMPDLVSRIAAVPEHAIVLLARQTMRTQSQDIDQFEALSEIVTASRVPVLSTIEDLVGRGIVGGHVWRFEENARQMAEMTTQIVNGTRARDIPPGRAIYATVLDWKQLERWRIPESSLPAGSMVLFQPPTFFERYRRYVVGALLTLAVQLALIVGLLAQRTRLRRAEEESRRDRERYRSVVDSRNELICRMLPDTTLTFVNDAYCRFWGRRRDELTGTKFIGVVPTWARQTVRDAINRAANGMDSSEHPVVLSDGTIGWQRWVCLPIVDGRGRVVEWQGVGRDITDQKRAEESLGDLEARNSAMLRAIPDLMFVLRRDGTYVDYHARDTRLLFLPPECFLGRTVRDVMPPALAGMLMDAIERAFGGDDAVIVEYALQVDELRYFEARLVVAEHDRVLSIVRDVTESKRAHALNRDLAGRLITSQEVERTRIARDLHDGVCQDIASLSVAVSQVRQGGGDVKSRDVQDKLRLVQKRAESVAESVRLLSHGLHSSVLHHIGLVAALQAHCAEVERQHDVRIRCFVDGEVEPTTELVGLSLFRIAQEALRNSARHGHARHASVSLSRKDGQLTLVVADDGRGFDVAAVRRSGAGLGLVSIEERARLVKGRSIVTSRPGRGTIVNIQVPLDDGAESRDSALDDAERPVRTGVNRPADDDEQRRT